MPRPRQSIPRLRTPRLRTPRRGLFLAAALVAARLAALDPQIPAADYLVRTWQTEDGLPSNKVRDILQDRDGYLVVATHGGAARFDGDRFNLFTQPARPDYSPNGFVTLAETPDGALWLGASDGLRSWKDGKFTLYSTASGLPSDVVQRLAVRNDGSLVVGVDHGVAFVRGGRLTLARWEAIRGRVRAYHQRADGTEFIGTDNGVWRVPPGGPPEQLPLAGASFNAFQEEPDGSLWIGCSAGLRRLRPDGRIEEVGPERGLANVHVQSLLRDRDGNLWIGTGGGLFRMRGGRVETALSNPPYIQALFEDRDGTLWVGTFSGLLSLRNRVVSSVTGADGLANTSLTSVMESRDGSWWMGTMSGGVFRYRPGLGARHVPVGDGPPVDYILSFGQTADGAFWVGSTHTAMRLRDGRWDDRYEDDEAVRLRTLKALEADPSFASDRIAHRRVFCVVPDGPKGAWIGTSGALYRFDGSRFRVVATGAPATADFRSVLVSRDGDVWAATSQGVYRLAGGRWRPYHPSDGLSSDETLYLHEDSAGIVWVTTPYFGLNRFAGGRWRAYRSWQGLVDDRTVSVIDDGAGALWIGCTHGIMRIERRQFDELDAGRLPLLRPQLFTRTDGMPVSECNFYGWPNVWRTRDGRLLFPTDGGLAVVDPRRVQAPPGPPPVRLEGMAVEGRPVALAAAPRLPAGTADVEFRYTAIDFLNPRRVIFRVRLSPFDSSWRDVGGQREVRYPRLPHGRYAFEVTAANGDGTWNAQAAAYEFEVLPYFYQTAWFRAFALALAVGAGAGAYLWRVTRLHRRARELQRQNLALEHGIAARTRELALANTAKTEFLENISHEIRNPLNGIIGLVGMLGEASLEARERELAHSLRACSKALARVFEQVLNFAKLEHGQVAVREAPFSLGDLVEEVAALFRVTARQRGVEIVVGREGEVPDRLVGDEEKIESILSNFVANAVKYAPGSPVEILVQAAAADAYGVDLTFNVTDRGPGIPPDEQELIFKKFVRGSRAKADRTTGSGLGLATCRVLAELLGGHVGVESEPGRGATFFLSLRLKRDRRAAPAGAVPPSGVPAGARALIVEDQPYNQIVVRRMAELLGYSADVAQDAEAALARLASRGYAVVFIDWELPGAKGDELARRARAQDGGRDAVLIATTAHDRAEIQERCRAAGMDGFALKPFDFETIARLIDEAQARRGRPARPAAPALDTRVFRFVGYDDPRQEAEAAALYLEILGQEEEALDDARRKRDGAAAARIAHRFKSHAGLVGAAALREAAERLQSEAGAASPGELDALCRELLARAGSLRESLRSWRPASAAG